MKNFLADLFDYSDNLNQILITELHKATIDKNEKPLKLLNHIVASHHIWNSRILGVQSTIEVWPLLPDEELILINRENFSHSHQILQTSELDSIIAYKNLKGENFQNSLRDILFHVINHATHHRGQIATLLKENNLHAVTMDYIAFKRKGI
jgi:uncharacterized damage-inducible protein DinB